MYSTLYKFGTMYKNYQGYDVDSTLVRFVYILDQSNRDFHIFH